MRTGLRWITVAALGALLSSHEALGQQAPCPNPSTGPLIGTTSEFCLTNAEAGMVDFNQPVFVTTNIGPVTTVNFSHTATVARARWTNLTCLPAPCAAAANNPDPHPGAPVGNSAGGFSTGQASGCSAIVTQEMCLTMFQGGLTVIQQSTAACPIPPAPPCGGGPPAQSVTAACPCPTQSGMIPECTEIEVPITGTVSGTVNYIDCTDSANWTDLNGAPQTKTCFNVRQRCICATVSGPFMCDTANMTVSQPFLNFQYPTTIPVDPVDPSPPFLRPDEPGDGFDPPHDGE